MMSALRSLIGVGFEIVCAFIGCMGAMYAAIFYCISNEGGLHGPTGAGSVSAFVECETTCVECETACALPISACACDSHKSAKLGNTVPTKNSN